MYIHTDKMKDNYRDRQTGGQKQMTDSRNDRQVESEQNNRQKRMTDSLTG